MRCKKLSLMASSYFPPQRTVSAPPPNPSLQRTGSCPDKVDTLASNAGGEDGQDEGAEEGFSLHG